MITFTLGALAAVAVGVNVWLVVGIIRMSIQVKRLEEIKRQLFTDIESRCNSIERDLHELHNMQDRRIDDAHSYVDSRLNKLNNHFQNVLVNDYVSKKNRLDNSIDYNN